MWIYSPRTLNSGSASAFNQLVNAGDCTVGPAGWLGLWWLGGTNVFTHPRSPACNPRLRSLTFAVALGAGLLLGPSVGSAAAVSSGTYEKDLITSSNRERVAKKQVALKASVRTGLRLRQREVGDRGLDEVAHRANLRTPQHRLIGVGAYQDSNGRWYVAQVLGQARNL